MLAAKLGNQFMNRPPAWFAHHIANKEYLHNVSLAAGVEASQKFRLRSLTRNGNECLRLQRLNCLINNGPDAPA